MANLPESAAPTNTPSDSDTVSSQSTGTASKAERIMVHRQRVSVSSGPLPPPEILVHYDEIIPGLAERIVTMAEKEQQHVHRMEHSQLDMDRAHLGYFKRGQSFGFIIALSAIVLSGILAIYGHDTVATTLVGFALTGLVGAFIFGYLGKHRKSGQD